MIVELGHFALILAFFVALVQCASPILGLYARDERLFKVAEAGRPCYSRSSAFHSWPWSGRMWPPISRSSTCSRTRIPPSRCFIKSPAYGGATKARCSLGPDPVALRRGARVFRHGLRSTCARVLGVQSSIASAFLGFFVFTSNPFLRLAERPSTAPNSIRCCRTPASSSIRRFSIWAMSASRWHSPSPSPP